MKKKPLFLVIGTDSRNDTQSLDVLIGFTDSEERAINAVEKAQTDHDRQYESTRLLRDMGARFVQPALNKLGNFSEQSGKQMLLDFINKKNIKFQNPFAQMMIAGAVAQLSNYLKSMSAEKVVDKLFGSTEPALNYSYLRVNGKGNHVLYVIRSHHSDNAYRLESTTFTQEAADKRVSALKEENEAVKRFGKSVHETFAQMAAVTELTDEKKAQILDMIGVNEEYREKVLAYVPAQSEEEIVDYSVSIVPAL